MKGNIRVFCRVRPLNSFEISNNQRRILSFSDNNMTLTLDHKRGLKEFTFDRVFKEDATQEEIYNDSSVIFRSLIDISNPI